MRIQTCLSRPFAVDHQRQLESGDRADLRTHRRDQFHRKLFGRDICACLQNDEADRDLAFERVGHADNGTLRDGRMRGQNLFHGGR